MINNKYFYFYLKHKALWKLLAHGIEANLFAEKYKVPIFQVPSEITKLLRWLNVCLRLRLLSFTFRPGNGSCDGLKTSYNQSLVSHSFFTVIKVVVHNPFDD